MRNLLVMMCLAAALVGWGGCGSEDKSPCQMLCEKWNSCRAINAEPLPCPQICVYGGHFAPGVGPSPYCPNLAAQTTCVAAAVQMSCQVYDNTALAGCPACAPLTGGPCRSDLDCQKYDSRFRCDLSRPGGYCTAPCSNAFDCSEAGPEVCLTATPSFDPDGAISAGWCQLGCGSDALCRVDEGYTCQNGLCATGP